MTMTKPTSEQVTFLAAGTGASQRTVLDKLRDVVSVKDFGAVGDGTTDDTAAIQTAMAALSASQILFFPNGTYRTVGNMSITVPAMMEGKIQTSAASVLTISKAFSAERLQVFVLGAGATVTFGYGAVDSVCPEWWGAVADGTTDCAAAIVAANNAHDNVSFSNGVYAVSPIKVTGFGKTWRGVNGRSNVTGTARTILRAITSTSQNTVLQHYGQWCVFEDIEFDGNAKTSFVVALTQSTLGTKFLRCSFNYPTPTTGICLLNTSTNAANIATVVVPGISATVQGDSVIASQCSFIGATGAGVALAGYYAEGTNSFLCSVTNSDMKKLTYGAYVYGSGVNLDDVEFSDVGTVFFVSVACQPSSLTRCYTETATTVIVNSSGHLGTTGSSTSLYMAHNYWNANTTAFIPAGLPFTSINNYQANGYMSLDAPVSPNVLTQYGQSVSIGDRIDWTAASPVSDNLANLTVLGGNRCGALQSNLPYMNRMPALRTVGAITLANAGATPNYGNNRTVTLTNTSPQNVTGFSNTSGFYAQSDACEEIIVYGDANTTLVHNGTGPLRLQGNANVTLGSIKNITLQRSGGGTVWREIARTT